MEKNDNLLRGCNKNVTCELCSDGWHVILSTLDGNKIVPSQNNPNQSGQYLCTCIARNGDAEHRYLRVMEYDADKKYWHDIGNKHGISHTILAWKYEAVCAFSDFDYKGYALFEKQ